MANTCKYGFYTCAFIGQVSFCDECDGGQNYQEAQAPAPAVAPEPKEGTWYMLTRRKTPKGPLVQMRYLYQGQDLGGAYTFVSDMGIYKVKGAQLASLLLEETV